MLARGSSVAGEELALALTGTVARASTNPCTPEGPVKSVRFGGQLLDSPRFSCSEQGGGGGETR